MFEDSLETQKEFEEDCEKHPPQKLYNIFQAYAHQGMHTSQFNLDSAWGYSDEKLFESLDKLLIIRHNASGREVVYEKKEYDDTKDKKNLFEKALKELQGEFTY